MRIKTLVPPEKAAIVAAVVAAVAATHPEPAAACLHTALFALRAIQARGLRAILQAGTMNWPILAEAEDCGDPLQPTHFSYQWEDREEAAFALLKRRQPRMRGLLCLPELHVWAAIPETGELVDLTTRYLPAQAARRAGLRWTAPLPPDVLWVTAAEMPPRVQYIPSRQATELVVYYLAAAGLLQPGDITPPPGSGAAPPPPSTVSPLAREDA